ncbi:GIY-YIG nuclease family protein [Anabaena sp. UHCC 0187]|uniref:GIY-YIG nuclease family protein n=1 Tax=Anabaena sp. UHCC 0187 TaxID=2590018 RepID=UPI00144759C2|nr:GIY-YIG nuclease family protein [Anabaena sp. UHCC 0187]MTJ11201.1 GIY-YIG nuclease family protein [Anabaena sp. UHCC 0187]
MWDKQYGGDFNKNGIDRVTRNMRGIYYIHSADFRTVYIGKSDDCIYGRLSVHLNGSSNRNLRSAVNSGVNLLFFCWESADPKYEEAQEIKRLKESGQLKGQRRELKPLIEELD